MITDDIALTLHPRIGPRTAAHLLECFGTAEELYEADSGEIVERAELNADLARQIAARTCHRQAEQELAHCAKNGITPIASYDERYPALLRECGDFPHVIYFRGNPEALGRRRMLAVVGTRRMTAYGQKAVDRLIGELAEICPDVVIVSGLAYGIDGASHRAALNNDLPTVGVLANPVTTISPAQHERLAAQMLEQGGALVSEYHSQMKMKGVTFLARNRIIAGMGAGTLVVESPLRGGSMITASLAGGYGRSVMAPPGRIGDGYSEGTNRLITGEMARMVCSGEDIARELGWWDRAAGKAHPQVDLTALSPGARGLLERFAPGEAIHIDTIAEIAELSMTELAPLLFELEFGGALRMLPGKMYERL
jgi:DNA processing protein